MVSGFEKIVFFPEALTYAIGKLPLPNRIAFIFGMVFIIAAFFDLIIFPLIFNLYLIPKIEVKLTVRPIFRYGSSPNWFLTKKSEVVAYITDRYFAWKKYNDCGLPAGYNGCALKFAGYTIKTVSLIKIQNKKFYLFSFLLIV